MYLARHGWAISSSWLDQNNAPCAWGCLLPIAMVNSSVGPLLINYITNKNTKKQQKKKKKHLLKSISKLAEWLIYFILKLMEKIRILEMGVNDAILKGWWHIGH